MPKTTHKYLVWIGFLILIYFPIFQDIDRKPIQMWDESRNAHNAFEMTINNDFLIRHFNNEPDMWELKPPLLIWLQSTSMRIFGYTEFAVRFPISLAVLGTVFLLLFFSKREFDNYYPGMISSLILVTSSGYIHEHMARSGDHDAVLILFVTAAALNFYFHLKYFRETSKYLIYTTIFLILAVYTKSIAGFFILPGLLIYSLYKRNLIQVLTDYRTYISIFSFLAIVALYYGLREYRNPGYLNYVWNDELFPRFQNTEAQYNQDEHPFGYYFFNLYNWRYQAWIASLVLAPFFMRLKKFEPYKDLIVLCFSIVLSMLFILSTGTKKFWYDGQVFPFLAIISGVGLYFAYTLFEESLPDKARLKSFLPIPFILLIFFNPYKEIVDKVYKAKEDNTRIYNGSYFRKLKKDKPSIKNIKLFYHPYNASPTFYAKVYNKEYNYNIDVVGEDLDRISVNDTIMSCAWERYGLLDERFVLKTIDSYEHCRLYVVVSIK